MKPMATDYRLRARAKRGFTLLELLVVIAIVAVVGIVSADIFSNVTRSYNKADIITRVQRTGNAALSQMVGELRNARTIVSPDPGASGSTLTIENANGSQVIFSFVAPTGSTNGYIARNSVSLSDNSYSNGVNVTSLVFSVSNTDPAVVAITAALEQPLGAPGRVDFKAAANLQTSVSLRTY